MTARYSSTCMMVHGREHPNEMKLGGTAEVMKFTPVLSKNDGTGFLYYRKLFCIILYIIVDKVFYKMSSYIPARLNRKERNCL